MWGREISGDVYKLWGQSSCSVLSHKIIKQYMHTVTYMALHSQDTLSDLSMSTLGDNCYLPNTLQSRSKLFQGGVVELYIPNVVCRGMLLPKKMVNWALGDCF